MVVRIGEKQLTGEIVDLARMLGWLVFHPWISVHSEPGFPDLCMVRDGRILFAELKVGTRRLTPQQERWRDALRLAGVEWHEWRDSTDRQAIADVLSAA